MSKSKCLAWSRKALQCAAVISSLSGSLMAAGSRYRVNNFVHYKDEKLH